MSFSFSIPVINISNNEVVTYSQDCYFLYLSGVKNNFRYIWNGGKENQFTVSMFDMFLTGMENENDMFDIDVKTICVSTFLKIQTNFSKYRPNTDQFFNIFKKYRPLLFLRKYLFSLPPFYMYLKLFFTPEI